MHCVAYLLLVLTGCRAPDAVFFPQHVAGNQVFLALHTAQLIEADGCLWLRTDTSMHLAIWPNTVAPRWNGSNWEVLDSTGRVLAVTGRTVVVVGGELPRADDEQVPRGVTDLVKVPIPERCAANDFWKVEGIRAN